MKQSQKNQTKASALRTQSSRNLFPLALIALGVVVLLGVGLAAWRGSSRAAGGTPSLKADKEKVDLGDVPLGQTVSVAFELTNTGDAPLRFKEPPYIVVAEGC
jgi:hypothetical protein